MTSPKKLLFICTYNLQRSPTAERLFSLCENFKTASAGTSIVARIRVTQELIDWADVIFVMSEKGDRHESTIRKRFTFDTTPIYDLNIDDRFLSDEKELKSSLIERVGAYIDISKCQSKLLSAVQQ